MVIKVGTRVLTGDDNLIRIERIERLAAEMFALKQQQMTVVLVSSGAVGAGIGSLGLSHYPRLIPDRQAVASVGQVGLMKMWEQAFAEHGWQVGQVLRDTYPLPIPSDASAGIYTVRVGMYTWPSLERLPISMDSVSVGDSIDLGSIQIQP